MPERNENENKSPLLRAVELLEQNGYYVFKAEEISPTTKPAGTIELQVFSKEEARRPSVL